jgi:hypothetical protein
MAIKGVGKSNIPPSLNTRRVALLESGSTYGEALGFLELSLLTAAIFTPFLLD